MASVRRSALTFVVEHGQPADARVRMRLVEPAAEEPWLLVAAVEPLRGIEADRVSRLALDQLLDCWAQRAGESVESDLLRAFAEVHRALRDDRREQEAPGSQGMVGLAAVALDAGEAVVAMAGPGRAIIAGPGGVQTVPAWPAWDPDLPVESGSALGGERVRRPLVERIDLRFGDVLVLCSSAVGAEIWRREAEGKPLRGLLTALSPDSAIDQLIGVAIEGALTDGFGCVLPVGPSQDQAAARPGMAGAPSRSRSPRMGSIGGPGAGRQRACAAQPSSVATTARPPMEHAPALEQARWRMVEAVESRAGSLLPAPDTGNAYAPGVMSISRYNTPPDGYADWRGRLPMLDGIGGGVRTLGFAVLFGALLGSAGFGYSVRQERIERGAAAIELAGDAIAAAVANPRDPNGAILAAEAALEEARRNGADPAAIRQTRYALEATRDRAWGITRLEGMRRVGSLPVAIGEMPLTLLATRGSAYLAGYGLYEIDVASGQLVQILAPGMEIGGARIGPIVAGVADRLRVTVTDGQALYRQDEDGIWQRYPLGPGGNPLQGRPVGSFNGMLYSIAPGGSILRYQVDEQGARSETWASVGQYPDLAFAQELAVNARVHVLLEDGTVDTFYEGALEGVSVPTVTPAPAGKTRLVGASDSGAVYLVDPDTAIGDTKGRILGFVPGGSTRQFAAPAPGGLGGEVLLASTAIADASQIVVVERTGAVFMLVGKDVWMATMPPDPAG